MAMKWLNRELTSKIAATRGSAFKTWAEFRISCVLLAAASLVAAPLGAGRSSTARGAEPASPPTSASGAVATGPRRIDSFTLRDFRGANFSLADWKDKKLVVVAFLGTECPLAKSYGPKLARLAADYGSKGVAFVAIFSNQQDPLAAIAQYAKLSEIKFPCLKDPGNTVADQFHATRTPEVFVLDAQRTVQYQGRIDDEFLVGSKRSKPTVRDLATALDELLADQPVSIPTTQAVGCFIGRVNKPDENSPITYSKQIARIFKNSCVDCHRPGEAAPFVLTNYADAAAWSETIAEVVRNERMPPWNADPQYGKFRNDCRLSSSDKETIFAWVKAGAPEGNAKDLPEPKKYTEGWRIGKPDAVYYIADKPVQVPATGDVKYQYFVVDPGFKEDKWVQAAECKPGCNEVVHHILVYVKPPEDPNAAPNPLLLRHPAAALQKAGGDFPSDWLVATAPGARPLLLPIGLGKKIPAGSKFVFQLHYTPNGKPQQDRSCFGIRFAESGSVKKEVMTWHATQTRFLIPPGDGNYKVESEYTFKKNTLLLAMFPHMHLRGKAFEYEAIYPDGKTEILLKVPHFDFNWQLSYEYAWPKVMPAGTKLHCTAWYDNSDKNPFNPNPAAAVKWGDQTYEEMMIGYFVMMPAE